MIEIAYAAVFVRQLRKLPTALQEEVVARVSLFKDRQGHEGLRVHKLHGPLAGRYSFSVNYKYRIVFVWTSAEQVTLLAVGDHDVYEK
jgi:plasmid maintenance system killer protein